MTTSFKNLLWLIAVAIFITYGIMAFNAGITVSPYTNTNPELATQVDKLNTHAISGIPTAGSIEEHQTIPLWAKLLTQASSEKYMYGDDSLMSTLHYYYEMGDKKRAVLSTHMMLGLLIMTCGIMQFWPAFRRKYRKAHRVLGAVYLTAGFLSMGMSCYHLINTPIDNIYSTFVFYIGLWLMLFGTVISMVLGMYYLIKKNIALHLGWQTLGFSMFLTAPLQRIDWFLVSPLHRFGVSFNEANIIVDMILFVQCLLIGYLIFCINRSSSPVKALYTPNEHPWFTFLPRKYISLNLQKLGVTVALGGAWAVLVCYFILNSGMINISAAHSIIPHSVILWETQLFDTPWLPVAYILAISVIIYSNIHLLYANQSSTRSQKNAILWMSMAAFVASTVHLYWGYLLGIPSHAHSGGGTFYIMSGILLALFGTLCWCSRNGSTTLLNERRLFLLLTAIAPALTYILIIFLAMVPLIPAKYIAMGHGYEITWLGGLYALLLLGFIAAIYNQETDKYRIH